MRSIVNNARYCLVCHTPYSLHRHHIYYGAGRRKLSEQYGCWCYLCVRHHNGSNAGVHFNTELDRKLKALTQKKFTEVYPDKDFLRIFGKNYYFADAEKCVACGAVIPEGRQVCPNCEKERNNARQKHY